MSTWHYYNEKGDKITITGGQLKWLAKNGKITPETIIETEEGKSAPARKVKGLTFLAAAQLESTTSDQAGVNGLSLIKPPVEENPFTLPALEEVNPFTATYRE